MSHRSRRRVTLYVPCFDRSIQTDSVNACPLHEGALHHPYEVLHVTVAIGYQLSLAGNPSWCSSRGCVTAATLGGTMRRLTAGLALVVLLSAPLVHSARVPGLISNTVSGDGPLPPNFPDAYEVRTPWLLPVTSAASQGC